MRKDGEAFTLIELLVAMTVLALLIVFLASALDHSLRILGHSNEQIEGFQQARTAFDNLARSLRSATLNTYWGYDNINNPHRYVRKSELHFLVRPGNGAGRGADGIFFQSARSYNDDTSGDRVLTGLLNTCGFYVEYGPDDPPFGISKKYRYRLKQILLPGSEMTAFASTGAEDFGWFTNAWKHSVSLGENIILLRAWPKTKHPLYPTDPESDSMTSNYSYNSRLNADNNPQPLTANQMPPLIDILMVAIDESSAQRIDSKAAEPQQITASLNGLFQTSTREAFAEDIKKLEQRLSNSQPRIDYRIFHTTLPIEESRWSSD